MKALPLLPTMSCERTFVGSPVFAPMPIAAVTDVRYNDQGIASGPVFTGQQLADATLTPRLAEAHPQAQVVNQALLSDFRPALLLAAAFAFLGALIAPVAIKGSAPR